MIKFRLIEGENYKPHEYLNDYNNTPRDEDNGLITIPLNLLFDLRFCIKAYQEFCDDLGYAYETDSDESTIFLEWINKYIPKKVKK